jgi:RelA/SpoT family (p)ppGpp synthetase
MSPGTQFKSLHLSSRLGMVLVLALLYPVSSFLPQKIPQQRGRPLVFRATFGFYGSSSSNNQNEQERTDNGQNSTMTTIYQASSSTWRTFSSASSFPDNSVLNSHDAQQIEQYWDSIMPTVSYLGTVQVAKIYQALCTAFTAHRGQMRKSGEPFIIHPVQVALLLSGLKMDGETVIAGLLHDTVEDTDMTFDQICQLFGPEVAGIVEGETKVSKLPKMVAYTDYADEQAENLRQMFVAMCNDYRIIIVKLADRLHNMRTLRHMKPEKQIKISRETLDIFAPLAHRMGIWQFKSELEDTAFMYLYPQEYKRLNRRLKEHQTKFRETLSKSQDLLWARLEADPTLQQQAAKVEIYGRTKEIYSLWHKMEVKGVTNLDEIIDVVALRVIITPKIVDGDDPNEHERDRAVWLCYHVLGLVQHLPGFRPVPTGVKDYISFPKPNGYQSLHTALILQGQTIEVQIRTNMMHQVAEYGMASHWAYTDSKRRGNNGEQDLYNTPWLSSIKEWQNDRISSRDFVDCVRRELLGKRVFVFLRNGKILNLARGATAIDAAFQIHTEVGLNMHGVDINGKPVSLSYELQNGDVVSVLTGEGKPTTDWMRYAKSRSTRSKLRAYFRARQKESLRDAGEMLVMDYLRMHGSVIRRESYLGLILKVPTSVSGFRDFLPGKTRYETVNDLLVAIGRQHDRSLLHKVMSQLFDVPQRILNEAENDRSSAIPSNIVAAVDEKRQRARDAAQAVASSHVLSDADLAKRSISADRVVGDSVSFIDNLLLAGLEIDEEDADPEHICEDCLPVYGDQVVGTRPIGESDGGFSTTVHRLGCPHANRAIFAAQAELQVRGSQNVVRKHQVDSVSLRRQSGYFFKPTARESTRASNFDNRTKNVPIKLYWLDMDDTLYLTEVVVHCQDRKLLLADCSEVVSETVEIVRTGSLTTNEHATLNFLVRVSGLQQLQQLMDRLNLVRSVMSVERRFGSELL